MKTLKRHLALFLLTLLFLGMVGCQTPVPAPGGVYEGKTFLLHTDLAIQKAWRGLDAFMAWELKNHTQIMLSRPAVFAAAEYIRTNAPLWFSGVAIVRSNYLAALEGRADPSSSSNALLLATQALSGQVRLVEALQR